MQDGNAFLAVLDGILGKSAVLTSAPFFLPRAFALLRLVTVALARGRLAASARICSKLIERVSNRGVESLIIKNTSLTESGWHAWSCGDASSSLYSLLTRGWSDANIFLNVDFGTDRLHCLASL